jgi:hypothetical protein
MTMLLRMSLVLLAAAQAGCSGRPVEPDAAQDGAPDADGRDADPDPADAPADTSADAPADSQEDAPPDEPDAEPVVLTRTNPVMTGDHPDPHVMRLVDASGRAVYYLTHTVGVTGDVVLWRSANLLDWEQASAGVFQRSTSGSDAIQINPRYYCHIWAPQMVELGPASYLLSFSATRYDSARACPGYFEDGGVYLAWSSSPTGPFAPADHPWEPLRLATHPATCPDLIDALPHAPDLAMAGCGGGYCHVLARLDSDVWRDPATGRWWMSYAWFTNPSPVNDWEVNNFGEHVEVVELDAADPFVVRCDPAVVVRQLANPHDSATIERLRASCPRCGEMLSMTQGRTGEMVRAGVSWGVTEGPSFFRRGEWVYSLMSGSAYDSAYYHVFWTAARSVEELSYDNPGRLVGRYLVPSGNQAFGHGTPVLGPDGATWYYVYHHLDAGACCSRDLWVSRIDFEDHGDGLGAVYISPIFPAESPGVEVVLPP